MFMILNAVHYKSKWMWCNITEISMTVWNKEWWVRKHIPQQRQVSMFLENVLRRHNTLLYLASEAVRKSLSLHPQVKQSRALTGLLWYTVAVLACLMPWAIPSIPLWMPNIIIIIIIIILSNLLHYAHMIILIDREMTFTAQPNSPLLLWPFLVHDSSICVELDTLDSRINSPFLN